MYVVAAGCLTSAQGTTGKLSPEGPDGSIPHNDWELHFEPHESPGTNLAGFRKRLDRNNRKVVRKRPDVLHWLFRAAVTWCNSGEQSMGRADEGEDWRWGCELRSTMSSIMMRLEGWCRR